METLQVNCIRFILGKVAVNVNKIECSLLTLRRRAIRYCKISLHLFFALALETIFTDYQ